MLRTQAKSLNRKVRKEDRKARKETGPLPSHSLWLSPFLITIQRPRTPLVHLVCFSFRACDPDIFNPLDGDSRFWSGLPLLGIDLPGHCHRRGTHPSGADVRHAFLDRGHPDAGLLRDTRPTCHVLPTAALAHGGGRHASSDGWQSHAFLR